MCCLNLRSILLTESIKQVAHMLFVISNEVEQTRGKFIWLESKSLSSLRVNITNSSVIENNSLEKQF